MFTALEVDEFAAELWSFCHVTEDYEEFMLWTSMQQKQKVDWFIAVKHTAEENQAPLKMTTR